ncbi:MAG: SurA N-terminal domain-containing protein [Rickettsiaceae bacterium]|nr:SurA N-terminal domain-containing protein [Rickettsiaceae bacterium]
MLNQIRKAADNLIFRAILLIIVFAFCIWGVKDMLGSHGNFVVASFKNAESIRYSEFVKEKYKEVMKIQRMNDVVLSEEDIKQYGIDNAIINRLITGRLVDLLVKDYDIDFSDEVLSSMIRHLPAFQNEEGKFDIGILKSHLASSGMTEAEYSKSIKDKLSQSLLLNEFVGSYYAPRATSESIVDFLSEERVFDVVSIDLASDNYAEVKDPSKKELEDFYKANNDLFTTEEHRDVNYLIAGEDAIAGKISITDEEVKKFFEENKDDISNLDSARKVLREKKLEDLMDEFIKGLEDEVAAGSSIEEISEKFGLKIHKIEGVTFASFAKKKDLAEVTSSVFGLEEGETSMPLHLTESRSVIIASIKKIVPAKLQDFAQIEKQVEKEWKAAEYRKLNMKVMEDFISTTKFEDFISVATASKLSLQKGVKIKRSEIGQSDKFSAEMIGGIFRAKTGTMAGIYEDGKKAYVIAIRLIERNPVTKKAIEKASGENIRNKLAESVIDELLIYMQHKERPEVNDSFLRQISE